MDISSLDVSSLRHILTRTDPLGPLDQTDISAISARSLLDDQVVPFRNAAGATTDPSDPYMLLLGRKGAGKSAILTDVELNLHTANMYEYAPKRLPQKGEPFVIKMDSWELFMQITEEVWKRSQERTLPNELIPPEYYATLWVDALWEEIFICFCDYTRFKEVKRTLAPLSNFFDPREDNGGPTDREERRIRTAARRSITSFLEERESKLYFLFDSMEDYPVRDYVSSQVFSGLFKALRSLNTEPRIHVSFTIPEELEDFLNKISSNLMKDFATAHKIRWRPIDLLRIVAHRYRIAMAVHDREFFHTLEDLDFSRREDIRDLFNRILPTAVINRLGEPEDPLAYIIRHTQLLPRHILAIFNLILRNSYDEVTRYRKLKKEAITAAVGQAQHYIAEQILKP